MVKTGLNFSQDWQYLSTRQGSVRGGPSRSALPLSFQADDNALVEIASVLIGPESVISQPDALYETDPSDVGSMDWADWSAQHLRLQQRPTYAEDDSMLLGGLPTMASIDPSQIAPLQSAVDGGGVRPSELHGSPASSSLPELQWGSDSQFSAVEETPTPPPSSARDEPVTFGQRASSGGFTEFVFQIQTPEIQAAMMESSGRGGQKGKSAKRRKSK